MQIPTQYMYNYVVFCLIGLILYVPFSIFSVMSGPVFLGFTSIKQRIKCFDQGHNAAPPMWLELDLNSGTLPLSTAILYIFLKIDM